MTEQIMWAVLRSDGSPLSIGADEAQAWIRAETLRLAHRNELIAEKYRCVKVTEVEGA